MKCKKLLLGFFIIMTLLSGWIGVWLDKQVPDQVQGDSLGMAVWLFIPFFLPLIIRGITRDWSDAGFKINLKNNKEIYLISLLIFPLITIFSIVLAKITGTLIIGSYNSTNLVQLILIQLGLGFVKNIFEEFAWRGYLTPKLMEVTKNDWIVYLVAALVWALWHLPYYMVFLPADQLSQFGRIEFAILAIAIMILWTPFFTEIYRISKSTWPCVLAHMVEDAVPTLLIYVTGLISFTGLADFIINPISGIIPGLIFLYVGLYLRNRRVKKENLNPITN